MKTVDKKTNYYLRIFQKSRFLLLINLLLAVAVSACGAGVALLLKNIVDIAVDGDMGRFSKVLMFNLFYLSMYALVYYLSSLLSKLLMKNVIKNLRKSVFDGIIRRSYQDYNEVNSADYISVLTNDIKMVEENYIQPLMGTIQNLFSFIFTLVLLIRISPIIILILFVGLILMVLIPALIGQKLQKKQEALSMEYSSITSKLKDVFMGFEVIKSFQLTSIMRKQFDSDNTKLITVKYKVDKLFVLNETVSQFLAAFTQIITIFAAAYLVIKGAITIGSLIAVMQLAGTFVMPLVYLMQNFPKIQSIAPIMKRMQEFDEYQNNSFTGMLEPVFNDRITLKDVSFSYQVDIPVLKQIHMEIKKGKKYAIVGESGCGKSTLAKLMAGYYPGYSGEIMYDNRSLKECDVDKINLLNSIIHQNVYMFDRSIRDNICLFQDYSMEVLNAAISKSGIDKFLPVMQEDLDTIVGENGTSLSGGQRQRIAIARALIKDTPILILDEGTSAIDLMTSNEIERNLINNKELTLITITHKLNEDLLGLYDEIIYMENGCIVETGRYQELYNARNKFYSFCVA